MFYFFGEDLIVFFVYMIVLDLMSYEAGVFFEIDLPDFFGEGDLTLFYAVFGIGKYLLMIVIFSNSK